jgi:hypothetical protein
MFQVPFRWELHHVLAGLYENYKKRRKEKSEIQVGPDGKPLEHEE